MCPSAQHPYLRPRATCSVGDCTHRACAWLVGRRRTAQCREPKWWGRPLGLPRSARFAPPSSAAISPRARQPNLHPTCPKPTLHPQDNATSALQHQSAEQQQRQRPAPATPVHWPFPTFHKPSTNIPPIPSSRSPRAHDPRAVRRLTPWRRWSGTPCARRRRPRPRWRSRRPPRCPQGGAWWSTRPGRGARGG